MYGTENQPGFSGTFNDPTKNDLRYTQDEVTGSGDVARRLCEEIVMAAYKEAPELEKSMPKKHSKILNSISHDRKNYAPRNEEVNAKTGDDCQKEYESKREELIHEIKNTKKLEEDLATKQQRYIKREQEYRKTIEELQEEIKSHSINPFKIEGKGPEDQDEEEIKDEYKYVPSQQSKQIVEDFRNIISTIDMIQVRTAKTLLNQKKDYCNILNEKYNHLQQKIDHEKEKTGENTADFKQREKELKENLQTMTQIAQRIDNENINLIKKNSELNIEFKSQEQDKDLLIKQIIQQKKINKDNMAKLTKVKTIAEELEKKMKEEQKMSEASQSSKANKASLDTSIRRKTLRSSTGKKRKGKKGTRIIMSQSKKSLKGASIQQDTIINMKTSSNFLKPGGRAYSANVYGNPKLRRYEEVINKLKK